MVTPPFWNRSAGIIWPNRFAHLFCPTNSAARVPSAANFAPRSTRTTATTGPRGVIDPQPTPVQPARENRRPSRPPVPLGHGPMSGQIAPIERPHEPTSRRHEPTSRRQPGSSDNQGTWAPLRTPIFRWFWLASLLSNLGTWVHEVGAGWLMTSLDSDPSMVSAVRVAISLPIMFLAIPVGGLTDRVNRRTVLIITTLMLLSATVTLTVMTYNQTITAWWLLALTFAIGVSMVGHMLAWQATVPEMVPRDQMSRAVALGSISFNLARSVGPALGGVLIVVIGTWSTFGFNAASFAGVGTLLLFWRSSVTPQPSRDSFVESLRVGLRYCWKTSSIRSALFNLAMFVLPASCLWALLPLYVRQDLGGDPKLYGGLVTLLGSGAVTAAMFLHRAQTRFGFDNMVAATMAIYGTAMLTLGSFPSRMVAMGCLFAMGAAWMMTLTTLNSTAQLNLPSDIRGRGMSLYVTGMSFSMAAGSFFWGEMASQVGVAPAIAMSGALLMATAVFSLQFRLQDDRVAMDD